MDGKTLALLILVIAPLCGCAWRSSSEERKQGRDVRRGVHYHAKRHMMPPDQDKKRPPLPNRNRDTRKKPAGHLTPLKEDDIDNDEVVSVAIGPPPMRPAYDKMSWKHATKHAVPNVTAAASATNNFTQGATAMVKDVLTQLGREFLSHQVNEDFVFGQYIGNAMKNLTSELKLKMQHEILELIILYQKLSRGEAAQTPRLDEKNTLTILKESNKYKMTNDTDETWPDFSNLAKIVG